MILITLCIFIIVYNNFYKRLDIANRFILLPMQDKANENFSVLIINSGQILQTVMFNKLRKFEIVVTIQIWLIVHFRITVKLTKLYYTNGNTGIIFIWSFLKLHFVFLERKLKCWHSLCLYVSTKYILSICAEAFDEKDHKKH